MEKTDMGVTWSVTEATNCQGCGETPVRQVTESLLGQISMSDVSTNTYHALLSCLFSPDRNLNMGQEALSVCWEMDENRNVYFSNQFFACFVWISYCIINNKLLWGRSYLKLKKSPATCKAPNFHKEIFFFRLRKSLKKIFQRVWKMMRNRYRNTGITQFFLTILLLSLALARGESSPQTETF